MEEEGKAVDGSGEESLVTYIVLELLNHSLFDLIVNNGSLSEISVKYLISELLNGV